MLFYRSDEDETGDSSKNMFSPYSLDTSDVDSSSVNTSHEFYNFSPSRVHFTSNRLRRHSVQQEDQGTEDPANDDLSVFDDTSHNKPLDLENNGLIWFPLPPDDEEISFFSYDDDDDEIGPTGAVFSSSDTLQNGPNSEHKKPLETVVQGHFRALVSQLLQSEFMEADEWLDIITSLAWQAANFVKPDTSRGGSMDPGDYVKIKCIASGSPHER